MLRQQKGKIVTFFCDAPELEIRQKYILLKLYHTKIIKVLFNYIYVHCIKKKKEKKKKTWVTMN